MARRPDSERSSLLETRELDHTPVVFLSRSSLSNVVFAESSLIPDVEMTVGDDRMRPGVLAR